MGFWHLLRPTFLPVLSRSRINNLRRLTSDSTVIVQVGADAKENHEYHDWGFVDKCGRVGLRPLIGIACHNMPIDGIFEMPVREHGIRGG